MEENGTSWMYLGKDFTLTGIPSSLHLIYTFNSVLSEYTYIFIFIKCCPVYVQIYVDRLVRILAYLFVGLNEINRDIRM
jgi:hypothetical protein